MTLARTYRIETERLVIRCYEPSDAPLLKKAIDESLEHLLPWLPWAVNEPETLEAKIGRVREFRGKFDLGQDYVFGIFDKTEKILLGSTGLHTRVGEGAREIGYWIHVDHIGKGYATEASAALTKVAFEIENMDIVQIHTVPENVRSQRVPKKLGYKQEPGLHPITDSLGNKHEVVLWKMQKADYAKSDIKNLSIKAFDVIGREIE